ncbi:hypothetical protein LC2W_0541 [Lacticaseibacillus paracasei]|nr:hypothetical protein LCAZH_0505 [Lacticaseibacillus paracasei]AEA52875.1 hypothetical protein LC2W_0541 [Lacticaseibacillus paracasei]AEA56038.1 hypothetical protein LCBD_0540 [Lacticaseibacillus paracasei]QHV92977.1 hypothetical protein EOK76_g2598 [Lacticaseibacillus paracasei]
MPPLSSYFHEHFEKKNLTQGAIKLLLSILQITWQLGAL